MENIKEIIDPFIKIPSLINIKEEEVQQILKLGEKIKYEEFEDFNLFSKYLDNDGLLILIYANENFDLNQIDKIEDIFEKKYGLKYLIGARVYSNSKTKYGIISIKNTSTKFKELNYLSETKKLIQELENPLIETEKVLLELNRLNITEDEKEKILNRLKFLGEIFEPKKGNIKTL